MSNDLIKPPNSSTPAKLPPRVNTILNRVKSLTPEKKNQLQVCFVCDSTGSMFQIFKTALSAIKEVMAAIKEASNVEMAFIAYKNHGDENYFDREKAFTVADWTHETTTILTLMNRITSAGGGDGLTCIEDVMRYINHHLGWSPEAKKIVVLIGDMPPHGVVDSVNRCPQKIDYRIETKQAKTNSITYYTVYCDTDNHGSMGRERKNKIQTFFQNLATETGGKCLALEEIQLLIAILTGICMKESGQIDQFSHWLSSRQQLGHAEQKILRALK